MRRKKILVVIGTRPEAIKLAPLIHILCDNDWTDCRVVLTGQHRDLVAPLIAYFDLQVEYDLSVMTPNQSLASITSRILLGMDNLILAASPDAVIGQGDTASVLATGLSCYFRKVPFAHVEAGLRTGNCYRPYPEEMNRILSSQLATWHFAPTQVSRENLLREGVADTSIWVTGNTVIDALQIVTSQPPPELPVTPGHDFVLITAHRRENFGSGIRQICQAIAALALKHPKLFFVFPVHPNPAVREATRKYLRGLHNVLLIEPCDYPVFCWLMKRALLILSDSGGVQEEAPALGKPVLVLRDETERPEALHIGATKLVGTKAENIITATELLLNDADAYAAMAGAGSPYGDGHASERIADALRTRIL